jgi:hypothetical protein
MTKFRIALIAAIITGLMISSCNRHIAQGKESKQYYFICPMHPTDIYYLSGNCLKCGMELEAWEMDDMPHKNSSNSHSGHSGSGSSSGSSCH